MARRGRLWPLVVAGLLTAGCSDAGDATTASAGAASPPRAESTSIRGHEGRFLGAVARRYEYPKPGITVTPPPDPAHADVPWTAAFGACFDSRLPCVTRGDATVSLGMVTGPDDAVIGGRRMFEDALTYLVVWGPGACFRPDLAGGQCRIVDLVTATQGNVAAGTNVYTFEVPVSSSPPGA